MIPCVFCVSLISNKNIFVLQKYQVPGMQECFLEEKLKALLIHSCRFVNVALDGKRQFSFWILILKLSWECRNVSFQGFPFLTAEMAGNLIKDFKSSSTWCVARFILSVFLNGSHILDNILYKNVSCIPLSPPRCRHYYLVSGLEQRLRHALFQLLKDNIWLLTGLRKDADLTCECYFSFCTYKI